MSVIGLRLTITVLDELTADLGKVWASVEKMEQAAKSLTTVFNGQGPASLLTLVELYRRYRVFTFGKYQGQTVASTPSDYLVWMLHKFESAQWKMVAAIALTVRGQATMAQLPNGGVECTLHAGQKFDLGEAKGDLRNVLLEAKEDKTPEILSAKDEIMAVGLLKQDVDWADPKSMVDYARKRLNEDGAYLLTWRTGVWEVMQDKFGADLEYWVADGKTETEAGQEILKEVFSLGKLEKTERVSIITLKHLGLRWTFEVRNMILIELEEVK